LTITPAIQAYHTQATAQAKQNYVDGLAPEPLRKEWRQVVRAVRKDILRTLLATNYLRDIYGALKVSGRHLSVLRALFAPPISQDQMRLIAPLYPKSAEKTGAALKHDAADQFASTFLMRRDRHLTAWLEGNGNPNRRQIKRVLDTLTPMISGQIFNTVRRNRLSAEQEVAVQTMLLAKGWTMENAGKLSIPGDLPPAHFMRNARCMASPTAVKDVDIACGVKSTLLLAMECKVSNDETNSVKRVSEVLDKAKSWQKQWGGFIQTAALLQGVIAYKEVKRLLETDVEVFWSHDLQLLADWLQDNA